MTRRVKRDKIYEKRLKLHTRKTKKKKNRYRIIEDNKVRVLR